MKLEEKGFFVKSPHLTFAAADVVTVLEGCCCCGSLKFATKGLLLTLDTSGRKVINYIKCSKVNYKERALSECNSLERMIIE